MSRTIGGKRSLDRILTVEISRHRHVQDVVSFVRRIREWNDYTDRAGDRSIKRHEIIGQGENGFLTENRKNIPEI